MKTSKVIIIILCLAFFTNTLFATGEIIIDSNTLFKPVKNSMASINNGDPIIYDDPANPSGTFFGVFHIRFKLDTTEVKEPCKILVYAQKGTEAWKKIAEITPGAKPGTGDWDVSFFWDSTKVVYDDDGTPVWDGTPFKENLKIRLKLISN